jgi:hypothetical protein
MGKRGRKPSKERKGYFYETEEDAVARYVTTDDVQEKNEIYHTYLEPAFTKMIESIIRRYNLYPPDEIFQETFDDTLSFLLTKIEHFKPESGFKAYSYCGTVCKNYLILKINQYNKNLTRNERYEDIQNDIEDNVKFSYAQDGSYLEHLTDLISDTSKEIAQMIEDKDKHKLSENEIKVGNALCSLLENWGELFARMGSNKFNKSSILLYLQEITLLDTQQIRLSMKKYRTIYQNIRKKMLDDIY